ncbi:hypothetical protein [Microbulbifer taiwanensis]|uniref:hypothetical protein n=1 Tax=Microbulbifer taiwanensis TaxID=986746 RepID=UPI00360642B3
MRVLLLCSAFNGLSQRIHRELALLDCEVSVQLATGEAAMERAVADFLPRLIICPYLVHRIPASIWRKTPALSYIPVSRVIAAPHPWTGLSTATAPNGE